MTNVTLLTQELVEQFESVVGRKATASEYMDLRKQAVSELSAGYFVQESVVPVPQNESKPASVSTSEQTNADYVQITPSTKTNCETELPYRQEPAQTKPVVEQVFRKKEENHSSSIQPVPAAVPEPMTRPMMEPSESVTQKDDKTNAFFALVNKFNS